MHWSIKGKQNVGKREKAIISVGERMGSHCLRHQKSKQKKLKDPSNPGVTSFSTGTEMKMCWF